MGSDPFGSRPQYASRSNPTGREQGYVREEFHLAQSDPFSPFEAINPVDQIAGAGTFLRGSHQNLTILNQMPNSFEARRRDSQDSYYLETESPTHHSYSEIEYERSDLSSSTISRPIPRYHTRRKPYNQDEFDGPTQLLPPPTPRTIAGRERALPSLPIHLNLTEQEDVLARRNDILSNCAFHFIAKYSFPIPLDRDKPHIKSPSDRDWTEWAYLLKRLATKRRIPARFLYENQIKQFVTTIENSIAVRSSTVTPSHGEPIVQGMQIGPQQSSVPRPKDDRTILQLISAGTQVAKIMMDAVAMEQLDNLYVRTENIILDRRARRWVLAE